MNNLNELKLMEAQINQIFHIIETAENREISKIAAETLANKCLDNPLAIYIIFKNFLDFSIKGKLRVFDDAGFLIDLILEEMDKDTIKKLFETEFFKDCIKKVYEENKLFYSFDHVNSIFADLGSINIAPFELLGKISVESFEGLYSNKAEDWANAASDSEGKAEGGFGKMDLEILFPIKDEIKQEIEQCMNVGKITAANFANSSNINRQNSNLSASSVNATIKDKEDKISVSEFYAKFSKSINLKCLAGMIEEGNISNAAAHSASSKLLNKKQSRDAVIIEEVVEEDEDDLEESVNQSLKENNKIKNSDKNKTLIIKSTKTKLSNNPISSSAVKKRKLESNLAQKREKLEFFFNPLFFVVEEFLKLNHNESWKSRLCSISSLTLLSKFFHLFYYKFFKISCFIVTTYTPNTNIAANIHNDMNSNGNNNSSKKKGRISKKSKNETDEGQELSVEISIEDIKITLLITQEPHNLNSLCNNNSSLSKRSNNNNLNNIKEKEFLRCQRILYSEENLDLQNAFTHFEKSVKENLFTSLFVNSLLDKVVDFDSEDYICIFKDLNLKLANKILDNLESDIDLIQENTKLRDLNQSIYLLLNKAINANKFNADWQPIFSILTFLKLKMTGIYKALNNPNKDEEGNGEGEEINELDMNLINNSIIDVYNNYNFDNETEFNNSNTSNVNNNCNKNLNKINNSNHNNIYNNHNHMLLFAKNSFFNFSFSNKEYSIFSLIESLMKIDSEEIVNITIQILDKLMEKFNTENYNSDHINISKEKPKIISIFKSFILLINNYDDIEVGVKYYFNCLHNFIVFFKNLNEKNSSLEDPQCKKIIEHDLIFYALNKNKSVRLKYFNLINNILEGKLIYFSNHRDFIQKNVLLAIQGICLETDEDIVNTQKSFVINIINSNQEACLDVFFNFSKFIIKLMLKKNVKEFKNFFIPNSEKFQLSEMEAFYSAFFVNDLQVDLIRISYERKLKLMIPIIAHVMKNRITFVSVLIKNLNLDFNELKISKKLLIFLKIYYNYLELIDEMQNKTLIVPNEILNFLIDNKKLDDLPLKISKKDIDSGIGIALKFFVDFLEKYISNYKMNLNAARPNSNNNSVNANVNSNNPNFLMEEFNKIVFIYNNLVNNRVLTISEIDDLLKIIFNKIKDYENTCAQQQISRNTNGTNALLLKNQFGTKVDLIYENFKIITNNLKKSDEDCLCLKIKLRAYAAISLFNHSIYSNIKFEKISIFVNPILNCLKINSKEAKVFTKNLINMVLNHTSSLDSRNKIMNLFIDNCLNSYSEEITSASSSNVTAAVIYPSISVNTKLDAGNEAAFNLSNPKKLKINFPLKYFFNFLSKSGKNSEMKKIFENFITAGIADFSTIYTNNGHKSINSDNEEIALAQSKLDNILKKNIYFLFNISLIRRDLNFIPFENLKELLQRIIQEENLIEMPNIEKYLAFIIINFSKLIDDEHINFDNSQIIDQIFSYINLNDSIKQQTYNNSNYNRNSNNPKQTAEKSLSNRSLELTFKIINILIDSQHFKLICINYIFDVIKFINSKTETIRILATNLFSKLMKIISYLKLDKSYETQIINMKKSLKGLDNFSLIKNFVQQKDVKQLETHKAPSDEFSLCVKIKENLRYYQIAGIKWLSTLTSLGLGLALCDDMGLGKTIQTLCCIANETKIYQEKFGYSPLSLIVCPNTLILNWIKESKKFFDESEFKLKKFEGKFSSINGNKNKNDFYLGLNKNNNQKSNLDNNRNCINLDSGESDKENVDTEFDRTNLITKEDAAAYFKNKKSKNGSPGPIEVYVTSYDKIREMDEIPEEFFYVVLDEAHIIKNPKTKLYQNIKKINAERRIILTGTPIQNNVMELWSLFNFLMPGFLGTENDFEIKFHKKIYTNIKKLNLEEKLQENIFQSSLNDIRKRIKPFILRRLKQDVLKELPDKIIQDYICEMTQVQKELYAYWDNIYSSIGVANKDDKSKESSSSNKKQSAVNTKKAAKKDHPSQPVLKIIDSMRKICNYPGLLLNTSASNGKEAQQKLENYKDKISDFNCSGKLKALEDILVSFNFTSVSSEIINNVSSKPSNNLISGLSSAANAESNQLSENKILIFSQYKAMLQIIKSFLETNFKSLKVKILSSEMKEITRFDVVNSFNSDPEINILLLTTSIGGLGLSLTAANIVIMYDHDWNPMRDLQAMDRAHRLGQKKTVEVFR